MQRSSYHKFWDLAYNTENKKRLIKYFLYYLRSNSAIKSVVTFYSDFKITIRIFFNSGIYKEFYVDHVKLGNFYTGSDILNICNKLLGKNNG